MADLNHMYAQYLIEQNIQERPVDPACRLPEPETSRSPRRLFAVVALLRARVTRLIQVRLSSSTPRVSGEVQRESQS